MIKSILLTAALLGSLEVSKTKQRTMEGINEDAPVKSCQEILIAAELTTVWKVLTDINGWSDWQKDVVKSRVNGSLVEGTTFDWKSGGVMIHSTLHTVNSHSELGWTGKATGVKAIHNWYLSESNGQTRVVVEESMEGLLARLFKKSFSKKLESGLGNWLEFLREESEKQMKITSQGA